MKRPVKIKFQNGLSFEWSVNEILSELIKEYEFINSDTPDYVVFGPYGNDLPPEGNYVRIGYFCENIVPDLSICEWAFGVPLEQDINNPRYKRIQWHGIAPSSLIKQTDYNPEKILASKTKFCNFLYSHKVPYREAFFSQLSKYKKVDAPGRSMNNMPGIDSIYAGNKWDIKKQFLSEYKFTIAFENDIFPGYQTEKLYDAMQADSIPIYYGDPFIGDVFNTKSFINAPEYLPQKNHWLGLNIKTMGQMDFEDMRPAFLKSPKNRIKRKIKSYLREYKTRLQFNKMDFGPLIEQVIALDSEPERYLQYLEQPWFKNNIIPENSSTKKRWMEIFNSR
ncbi:MAG: alpha(1,3/1,4) fucosyltransferase [Mucilaginibacter sp.]|nr:alpha(1,3/1,4) fucosyltransferase [Mucilaginibacter sp.]